MPQKRYLFYISQNYSFEILRPLQDEIRKRGDEVKWLATGNDVNLNNFYGNEAVLESINEAISYHPHASFVPGNIIPSFIPGLKVQVFHGLEWKKKGHFVIRDCFDLYCTHGAATTTRFEQLAEKHGWFLCRQFENEANPAYHRNTTGPEIIRDFAGRRLDFWVTGYGTGGTMTGAG